MKRVPPNSRVRIGVRRAGVASPMRTRRAVGRFPARTAPTASAARSTSARPGALDFLEGGSDAPGRHHRGPLPTDRVRRDRATKAVPCTCAAYAWPQRPGADVTRAVASSAGKRHAARNVRSGVGPGVRLATYRWPGPPGAERIARPCRPAGRVETTTCPHQHAATFPKRHRPRVRVREV